MDNVDVKELGEVIDMYKDMCQVEHMKCEEEYWDVKKCKYYMEMALMQDELEDSQNAGDYGRRYYDAWRYKNGRFAPKGRGTRRGYEEPDYYRMTPEMYREYPPEYWRDMDKRDGRMYYTESSSTVGRNSGNNSGMSNMRDGREGRSGMSRRTYMESKEIHKANTPQDKDAKMKELEHYLNELGEDVKEMIIDATPEEKQMLRTKLSTLVQKM